MEQDKESLKSLQELVEKLQFINGDECPIEKKIQSLWEQFRSDYGTLYTAYLRGFLETPHVKCVTTECKLLNEEVFKCVEILAKNMFNLRQLLQKRKELYDQEVEKKGAK